jgi:SRF-type transcription factor (DNA-binding and dimerisation domain)
MGRKKITIKALQTPSERKATFTNRVKGVVKKAQELSTLCDVPHLLIAFSTTGKPTFSVGKR